MKRTIVFFAVLCVFCTGSMAQNMVTNSGFDAGVAGWYRNHASATAAVQGIAGEDGDPCLQLVCDTGTTDVAQAIQLEPRHDYVFQLDLKRTHAGQRIVGYIIAGRAGGQDMYFSLGSKQDTLCEWQHFATTVRMPGDLTNARVLLLNAVPGATAWVDNVQVVPLFTQSGPAADYCPKLAISAIENAPEIDGIVTPGEWDSASHISGFIRINGAEAEAQTQAWITYDSTYLYTAVRADEPLMEQGRFNVAGHDAGGVYADECIELFIDADNNHTDYYHFAISAAGGNLDTARGEGGVEGEQYESGWKTAAHKGTDYYSVETAIPFATLAVAGSGNIWGINICRERHVPGHAENTAWSATGAGFHVPARFGDIVGLAEVSHPLVSGRISGCDQDTPGPANLTVELADQTGDAQKLRLNATISKPDGTIAETDKTIVLAADGDNMLITMPIDLDQSGRWQATVQCHDAQSGVLLYTCAPHAFNVRPLLVARVNKPWYRGRIFSKMNLQEIEIEAQIGLRDIAGQGLQLIVRGNNDGLLKRVPATSQVQTVGLPCTQLADGDYELGIQLINAAGSVMATIDGLTVTKLPPAKDEVWLDRQNNLYINGEPHFPSGFYSLDSRGIMPQAAAAGFSVFHTYASSSALRLAADNPWDWDAYLNAGADAGMRAFLGYGFAGDKEDNFHERLVAGEAPEVEAAMRDFVSRYRQHPGILAWYVYDEPALAGKQPEQMKYIYNIADSIDPYHPKVICQVAWSDARFIDAYDVLMPDPYPIRATNSRPLRSVAQAVRAARRTVNDEKPVWAVLQWYAYPEGRFPTPQEMRCMAFMSLAAGAKGINWYSFYHAYKGDKAHWPDMQNIGRELRACEDVVFAPWAESAAIADNDALELGLKQSENALHLIAINAEDYALDSVKITLPIAVKSCIDRLSGQTLATNGHAVTVNFSEYGVRVLDFEIK